MKILSSKKFYILITFFVFFILVIPWIYPYEKMELGTYNAYTESLITDGDLNIINQMSKKTSWYVTPTFNYPDILSSGTAIVWSPFFYYGHILNELKFETKIFGYNNTDTSQLILSIAVTIAIFLFLRRKWGEYFGQDNFNFIIINLFFSTGMFFYFIAVPTNNDITLALIVAFAFDYFYKIAKGKRFDSDWFLFGLLIGFILNFKTIGALYCLPVLVFLLLKPGTIKTRFLNSSRFLIGFLTSGSAYLINSFVQRGVLFEPRTAAMTGEYFKNNFFEIVLGGRGFLFISPIYIISILYIAYELYSWIKYRKINSYLAFGIFLFCWIKVFLLSFRFFSNEFFGARTLISDFSLVCIAFMEVYRQLVGRNKFIFKILVLTSSLVTFINSIVKIATDKYVFEISKSDVGVFFLYIEKLKNVFLSVCVWKNSSGIILFLPLILLLCFLLVKYEKVKTDFREDINSEQKVIFLLSVSLAVVTALNLINNQKNVKQLQVEGFFNDKAVVKGPLSFGYEGFISELNLELLQAKNKNDLKKYIYFSNLKEKYISSIQSEIIKDPLNKFTRRGDEAISVFDIADFEDPNNPAIFQNSLLKTCLKN